MRTVWSVLWELCGPTGSAWWLFAPSGVACFSLGTRATGMTSDGQQSLGGSREVTTAAYARPGSELFCLLPKASWGKSMGLFSGICQQHQPQQPHGCCILEVSRDFYPLLFARCVLPPEDGSRGIAFAVVAQQSISASCAPSSSSRRWTGKPSFLVVLFCTCEPRYSMCN